MKHRILSLLLAVVMVLVLLPVGAAADEIVVNYMGLEFNKVTHTIQDCTSNSGSIVIPGQIEGETVEKIGENAFANAGITSVTIPNTVNEIGKSAFDGCKSLSTVIIQDTTGGTGATLSIGIRAFAATTGLTSIVVPTRVESIGDLAFAESGLRSVVVESAKTFGANVFLGCNQLTSVVIPGMPYPANPFIGCTNLKVIHYIGSEPTGLADNIDLHSAQIVEDGKVEEVGHAQVGKNPEKAYCTDTDDYCGVVSSWTRYITEEPHDLAPMEEVAPTCTEPGHTGGKYCTICGQDIVPYEVVPATGHTWKVTTDRKEASCKEDGWLKEHGECENCDETYDTEEILLKTNEHTYDGTVSEKEEDWITLKGATCTETGTVLKPQVCTVCGQVEKIDEDHIQEHIDGKVSDEHIEASIDALGHEPGEEYVVISRPDDFTCEEGGPVTVHYLCARCGKEIETDVELKLSAGEHIYGEPEKLDKSVDPTCEEDGKLITQRTCTVCGYEEDPVEEVLPATGHKVTEWEITVPATCTKEGERKGVCEYCKETITETIAPLGHDFESDLVTEEVIKEATCTEEGLKYLICGREECDEIDNKKEVVIPMAPHTPTPPAAGTVLKEATCTDEGSIVYNTVCAVCGTDLQNTPIATPALGHDFGAWTTSGGVRTRTCQREGCGYTETDASTTPSTPSDPSTPSTPSTSTSYAVDVIRPANGTITVSTSSAKPGTTVSVTLRPNSGYQLDSVQVTRGGSGTVVSLTGGGSNRYTFTMPAARVEVRAVFSTVSSTSTNTTAPTTSTSTPTKNIVINIPQVASASTPAGSLVFVDVPSIHWASGEIAWACQRGFFSGSGGNFYPDNLITVRQMWMVMARMMNQNPASMEEARVWALNNGFASGANPNASVTRLQMATMLYRLARLMGSKNTNTTNLGVYTDSRNIPDASKNAVAWAVANGIITGTTETRLDPNVSISRAQACVILYRYYQRLF